MVDLIAYSQNDPRWAGEVYAGGTTFASAGCLVVCVAMIASLAYAERTEPPEVAHALRDAGAFSGNLLARPHKIGAAFELLRWGGAVHWRNCPADMELIARELCLYRATIVELKWDPRGVTPPLGNQHFVVVTAIDGDDAQIVDPWDGETKLLSTTRYRLPGWNAARTIYGIRMVQAL